MTQKCIHCGSEQVKTIQAGISKKTNKPYSAFCKCESCGKTFNLQQTNAVVPAPTPKVEALLQDILEQLNAIRVLLEMKRENLDPDSVPF